MFDNTAEDFDIDGRKIHEVGVKIGNGENSIFFRLKEHPRIGVKINKNLLYRASIENDAIKEELKKGIFLRKNGIKVPRYLGIILVNINDEILEGLAIELIENDYVLAKSNNKKIKDEYYREVEKIRDLGIIIRDSFIKEYSKKDISFHNVLYCKKKKKIYLIDFDSWKFPDVL